MYADNTVLFSESIQCLQKMLDNLYNYGKEWNLKVNISKTNIIVLRNGGRLREQVRWLYDNEEVKFVNSYNYLGILLFYTCKFSKTQKEVALQGRKYMFNSLKICKKLCLNIETKLKVFDTYVTSVLNYGCEV